MSTPGPHVDGGADDSPAWHPDWASRYIAVSRRGSTSAVVTAANFIRCGRISDGMTVLEMGAGHGRISELLAKLVPGLSLVALDVTRNLLDNFLLRTGTHGCRLYRVQADMDKADLPFDDNVFDAACSARVFHYLQDPERALMEAKRVVRPGGRVVVSVPNKANPVKRLTYRRARLYSPADVGAWFDACGFRDVTLGSMCFFPSTTRWYRAAALLERSGGSTVLKYLGGNVLVWGAKP